MSTDNPSAFPHAVPEHQRGLTAREELWARFAANPPSIRDDWKSQSPDMEMPQNRNEYIGACVDWAMDYADSMIAAIEARETTHEPPSPDRTLIGPADIEHYKLIDGLSLQYDLDPQESREHMLSYAARMHGVSQWLDLTREQYNEVMNAVALELTPSEHSPADRCDVCKDNGHQDQDADIQLVELTDPDGVKADPDVVIKRCYMCATHREQYRRDGYFVSFPTTQPD